ncbi:Bug family tripartite tricarboxylate transporter substrate binding protein [Pseudonocardia kunmingensis]|uniref:Tripartite-type tricarboxylate transporter receptor subunit TctC n=1 Tax=Pseudonocardia kunmingensis TaxID=630975 RepID=A0A543D0F2_9PSEU|nr:tripartite tricarboxylate transporter substrate binding protein [Pseudonocardia kunmingensis]TQM02802.1 tripartite-type tricarboxylate transporter receptor subunit TctC [Pseudonocardia kunmingensis]
MRRSRICATVLVLALAAAGCANSDPTAGADEYPADEIRMVVTYAAGGPTDLGGRAVARHMEEKYGVPVVAENVEGASGGIGTAEVANSKPDGYTIAMTTASAVSRVPLIEDVGYTFEDLTPIGTVTVGPGMVYVPAGSPYQSGEDLFAAAKANPDTITVGTPGAQSPQHVELVRMKELYGVSFRIVPFEGESPAMTGLIGGNVDAVFGSNAQVSLAQVDEGKARVVAVGAAERLEYVPDAPTLVELGFPELTFGNSTFILAAPAETPAEIVASLESALQEALADPETVKVLGEERVAPEFIGSEELSGQMRAEVDQIGPILQKLFA